LPTFWLAIFKHRYHRVLPIGLTEIWTNFLVSHSQESVPPSFVNRSHRVFGPTLWLAVVKNWYHRNLRIGLTELCNLIVGHLIGTTEIYVSVSPRFKSCYLWSNSVPPSFILRCHRVGHFRCNGWIFGDAYIYPFTTTHSKEKHSELFHTCPIQFSEREPPTHVLRSSHSTLSI
jgi:hypothetical protein